MERRAMPMRRVRPRTSGCGGAEDRLSALHDDLLLLILSRLDTRTALSTAVLARRWARIPRLLPALDFRVSDILPPEYDRTIALRERNLPRDATLAMVFDHLMADCEMDTMRSFANGVTSFLQDDGHHDRQRHVKTLRLEFFQTYDDSISAADRLITAAVGAWRVEDLEVVVRLGSGDDQTPPYSLPQDCFNLTSSSLRSLTLGKYCALPPHLHDFGALTKLVLRDIPASTPIDAYERLFKDCTKLQVLHLKSCCCKDYTLVVDAPCSAIKELILEDCSFLVIELRNLPMLVRLACCLKDTSKILYGSVPCLVDTNISFSMESDVLVRLQVEDKLDSFLRMSMYPTMTNLVVRFTKLRRYVAPYRTARKLLPDLKRLLIADLPSKWDVLWPTGLLMAAPALEELHIHVPQSDTHILHLSDLPNNLQRHYHLKELVIIGFTERYISLLKYVVSRCKCLQRIVLLKDGHVQYSGLWAWKMVGKETHQWSDDEEMAVRGTIEKFGLRPQLELTLG